MTDLKKQIWIFAGIFIVIGSFYLFLSGRTAPPPHQVIIGGEIIDVELARTDAQRELGLSGHKPLADNQGMLFVFDAPGQYGFWMKDMLYPLDIIWISAGHNIVHMEKDLSPGSYPKVFTPPEYSQYVLEVNAGVSDKNGWREGDAVKF